MCLNQVRNKDQSLQSIQLGLGTKAGCQAATFILQTALLEGKIILKADCSNAFNCIWRDTFLRPLYADAKYRPIWPLLRLSYQSASYLVLPDGTTILATEGTRQGGGESSFTFGKALEGISEKFDQDGVRYVQIVDDIFAIIEPTKFNIDNLLYTIQRLEVCLSTYGLKMNVGKTEILCPLEMELPTTVADLRATTGVAPNKVLATSNVCLGAVLTLLPPQSPDCLGSVVSCLASKVFKKLRHFDTMDNLQVSLHLQHLIFQTSVIPSLEYMLTATWVCQDEPVMQNFYAGIRDWYINHFFPPGSAASITVVLASKSSPLTKALLHLPIRAGGGLGLPCPELIRHRRTDLLPSVLWHKNKYPWVQNYTNCLGDWKSNTPVIPKMKPRVGGEPHSTYDRLKHEVHHVAAISAYPVSLHNHKQFRNRWHHAAKERDTRYLKIPPAFKRHLIQDDTFRNTLAALALFTPKLAIAQRCIQKTRPNRDDIETGADALDHILHCPGCVASTMVRKHNALNSAIRRVAREYGIDYSLEPRGFPVPPPERKRPPPTDDPGLNDECGNEPDDEGEVDDGDESDDEIYQERTMYAKKCDGPDALLNTFAGLTALEIHCSHQRLFYATTDKTNYNSVMRARQSKKYKYNAFQKTYPGVLVEIMSVSTGGVIHPEAIRWIKEQWLPVAEDGGRGLLRMLYVEVAFAVARSVGNVLQLAKLMK